MRNKIIAIDYDGTIALDSYPYVGTPNWPIINKAKAEQETGATLILWTCRDGAELDIAVKACAEWGLVFDAVNDNPPDRQATWNNNPRKVYADEYWDDHAKEVRYARWNYDGTCGACGTQILANYCDYCPRCGATMLSV